jgi:hypothetical protein
MHILTKLFSFEWDKHNIDKNMVKHNVANREAEEVFQNSPKFIFKDEKHSHKEERYGLFGITNKRRRLSVIFTVKKNKVRIISARDMSKKERGIYEEKIKVYTNIQE